MLSGWHWHFAGQTVDVKVLAIDLRYNAFFLRRRSFLLSSFVDFQGGL
jgi:hypothetical protein